MAKWVLVNGGSADADQIGKDGEIYSYLDLSFLPANVCAIQSPDGVTCEIEYGDPATGKRTMNAENVQTSTLSWWASVESTWQAAYDAAHPEEPA